MDTGRRLKEHDLETTKGQREHGMGLYSYREHGNVGSMGTMAETNESTDFGVYVYTIDVGERRFTF